jgi:hypothetical protein
MSDHPTQVPAQARNLWPIVWAIAALCAVLLAVLLYLLLSGGLERRADAEVNVTNAAAPEPKQAAANQVAAAPTMRDRPEAEQLAAAFRAVFGRAGPRPRTDLGEGATERAARMVWTSFGPVLLTEASLPDGCHACAGYVGAYYLRDTGSGFEVAARYPEAAPGFGWGNVPNDWRIVETFTTHPAIYAEGGYMGQGYGSSSAILVELRPEGPSQSSIDLGEDNSGAMTDESQATVYEGAIRNVVRGRSFDVVYTGTCAFTRRYVWRGNKFEPESDAVPACAGENQ